MLLRELEEFSLTYRTNTTLAHIISAGSMQSSAQAERGNALELTPMEVTLKDLVKGRVLGHLDVGARESVLARDASRFCN